MCVVFCLVRYAHNPRFSKSRLASFSIALARFAKLGASKVPKLLFWAKPGAIVPEETVRLCEARFANLETVFLGESGHYIAEDFPHEIGEKVAAWVKGFG